MRRVSAGGSASFNAFVRVVRVQVQKYSQFMNFPIYLWGEKTVSEEVPIEEGEEEEQEVADDEEKSDDDEAEVGAD